MTGREAGWWGLGVWVAGLAVFASDASAREYLLNQAYDTAKRGEVEVELYNDMHFTDADNDDSYNSKHQLEVEYGVLDHLQLGYYEVYTWNRADDWERDEFKIEAKLRFAEAGRWPADVALYSEYKNPNGHRAVHSDELENKVILSKRLGPLTLVGNVVFEKTLNTGSHWAYEYTAGLSYDLTPRIRLALETQQGLGESGKFGINRNHPWYLVPGLSVAFGPHVKLLAGPAFGLTRGSDDFQLKSIVEVEF